MMTVAYVPFLVALRAEVHDDVVPDPVTAGGWR
jgi:hypothetical protein